MSIDSENVAAVSFVVCLQEASSGLDASPTTDARSCYVDEGKVNITEQQTIRDRTLHRWIDAARRTSLSWTEIGEALGISKQVAQQRLKGVGADNEMEIGDGEEAEDLEQMLFMR